MNFEATQPPRSSLQSPSTAFHHNEKQPVSQHECSAMRFNSSGCLSVVKKQKSHRVLTSGLLLVMLHFVITALFRCLLPSIDENIHFHFAIAIYFGINFPFKLQLGNFHSPFHVLAHKTFPHRVFSSTTRRGGGRPAHQGRFGS